MYEEDKLISKLSLLLLITISLVMWVFWLRGWAHAFLLNNPYLAEKDWGVAAVGADVAEENKLLLFLK